MGTKRRRLIKKRSGAIAAMLGLFSFFSAGGGNLAFGEKRGIMIAIEKNDGEKLVGELLAVKRNSILIVNEPTGADVDIVVRDIKTLRIPKRSKSKGARYGFIQGVYFGAIIGDIVSKSGASKSQRRNSIVIGGVAGGLAGALIGNAVGLRTEDFTVYNLREMAPADLQKMLINLSKEARIRA